MPDNVDERYFGTMRTEVMSFVRQPVPARVLEIGCGTGATLAALKRMGSSHVCGVELFEAAAAKARARTGIDEVRAGDAQTHLDAFEDGSFDLVVASHVLEHLVDPWQAARAIHRVLAPNGMFIGAIPNVRHMSVLVPLVFRGRWHYTPSGILDRTHIRFFTHHSIREMLVGAGFSDIELRPDVIGALSVAVHRLSFGLLHGCAAGAYIFRGIKAA
jgi:SAM-dependent methyltransferase